ncbi:MAG: HYR domain-containing protein [Saprospirales bacterium]|nr:MAG: HYR domain-containing protein [Saprospirales bacterium]
MNILKSQKRISMQTSIYSLIFSAAFLLLGHSGISQISITDFNVAYEDDFTGFDGEDDPTGWTTSDAPGAASSTWQGSGTGSSNTGGKWSYGDSGSGATFDGSLGFLPSSTRAIFADITFQNNTGGTITALAISYVGEHWRGAENGRNNGWAVTYSPDQPDEESLPALEYIADNTYPDGVNPDGGPWEAVTLSDTLTGLDIPTGSNFTIRFFGDNGSGIGSRQGVAIDDFSLTAIGAPSDDPVIVVNPGSLSGFEYQEGNGPSASQTFELSGSDLDPAAGELTVDATGTDYEVSLDDNTFENSLDVAYTGGELSATTIFVRLKEGLSAGLYENQEIDLTGGGADAETLTVSGEVTAPSVPLPSLTAFDDPYEEDFADFVDENSFPAGWSPDDTYSYGGEFSSGTAGGLRGEGVLGFQLTGSAPNNNFTATLQLVNDIGSTIENLEITYLGKVGFETRDGIPDWTVSVNGSEVAELEYSTEDGVDELKSVLLTGLNIPAGDTIEIEWFTTSAGTSGQRRQIGATDVEVTALDALAAPDAPEFDLTEGTYFEDQTVFVSNFGDYASPVEVRYTTDGTAPNAGSELYDHGSGIDLEDGNGPVTLRAIAIDTNTTLESDETSADYTFPENVANIAAFRAGDDGVLYRITGEVVLLHIASFQNRHFVRDNSGSLIIYDGDDNIYTTYNPGDGITGFTGERNTRNNGALEVMEAEVNPGAAISFGNDISPVDFSFEDLSLDITGNLVRVSDVDFTSTGTFSNGTTYFMTDPSITGEAQFRTDFFDADYIGDSIPQNTVNLTALVIGFGSDYQLVARDSDDFETVVPELSVDLEETIDPTCSDSEDGSIEVTVAGGFGDLTLSWTGPDGFTSDQVLITGLKEGVYVLTVEDEADQEEELQVILVAPDEPLLAFSANGHLLTPSSPLVFEENTTITLVVEEEIAGVSPFDVNWQLSSADTSLTGSASGLVEGDSVFNAVLPAGSYTLDLNGITDGDDCSYPGQDLIFDINMVELSELEFANFLANPQHHVVAPGEEFDITIQVELSQLTASAAEIHLEFDTNYLEVVSVEVKDWGTGEDQTVIFNEFDNEAGTIDFSAFQLNPPHPANTIFDFYTITFLALEDVDSTEVMHLLDVNFPSAISYEGIGILNEAQSAFITIDKCLLFELTAESTPASCFNNEDGSLEVTPLMGEGPYEYSWSTGQSGSVLQDVGPGFYTVTVTDANDCVAIEEFEVGFIPDEEPPVVNCLFNEVIVDAEGACGVHIEDYTHLANFSDNCSAEEDLVIGQVPSPGLTQIAESITIFITAVDESGNVGFCSFLLNLDNFGDEPALDCPPSEIVVEKDGASCSAEVELVTDFVFGCEGGDIVNNFNNGGADASGVYPLGETEVEFLLIEEGDTLFSCVTNVIVEDNQAPEPIASNLQSITPASDSAAACGLVLIEAPAAETDCAGIVYGQPSISNGLVADSDPPVYEFTPADFSDGEEVVWVFTNPNSDASSQLTQFIQVVANDGPEISCPGNKLFVVDFGSCEVSPDLEEPIASDNCGDVVITDNIQPTYGVGEHTITYIATNDQGMKDSCEQTIFVIDNQAPEITCPENEVVVIDDGSCQLSYSPHDPEVSDNCGISHVVNNLQGPLQLGENEITFIVWDVNGNSASCTQTVTLEDETPPSIDCPADLNLVADEGSCEVENFDPGVANATYSCGEIISISNNAPESLAVGVHTVVHTATAENGISANCEQTIAVADEESPVVNCPDDISVLADVGSSDAFVALDLATATDNCEVIEIENDFNAGGADAGDYYPVGVTGVTFVATDAAGLKDSCVTTVEVVLPADTVTISGNISSSFGNPVPDTEVKVFISSSGQFSVFTDSDGNYSLTVTEGVNVTLVPERDFDWGEGVTTLDLIWFQRHILQIDTLTGPYVLLGGDANWDGVLSTFDLVLLQNLILDANPSGIPGNTSARFVPASYIFNDPQNPYVENFPEQLSFQAVSQNQTDVDWVAIKTGDANGDAWESTSRDGREDYPVAVHLEEKDDRVAIVVSSAQSDVLSGYQFEFSYDHSVLEFEGYDWTGSNLENISGLNFYNDVENDILRANWWLGPTQKLEQGDEFFRMYFKTPERFDAEFVVDAIQLKGHGKAWFSEVYDQGRKIMSPYLRWDESSISRAEYALHQNEPNPFSGETVIPFELPEDMEVTIQILDSEGRLIVTDQIAGRKGYNTHRVEDMQLVSGLYFYRIITGEWTATRKMIGVE